MNYSIKLLLVSTLTFLMVVGCSDWLDINEDPNNPTNAPIEGLMYNTTFETTRNTNRVGGTTSFFVQHLASPNPGGASDTHDSASYGTAWSQLYFNITNLRDLIDEAEEINAPHYAGVARIMKAYNLSLLVNMFGDVPYSEGFSAENLQPAYDSSEDVYDVIQQAIATGLTELQASESSASPGGDDMIFGGDLASWLRTGYALQARILNHYSKLPSYNPEAVLESVDNAFASNDEDFEMAYFDEGTATENPWYRTALNNSNLLLGGWLSTQVVDHMNGETYGVFDPRIEFITERVEEDFGGGFRGTPNGAGRGGDPEQGARSVLAVGSYYASGPTAALEMITYAEMKFVEAEAALAAGQTGRAYAAYEEGIRAHMEKLGVDQADIDAYWAEDEVSVGEGNLTIDHIMKEKYVATFLNPETWNDARRYDYGYAGFSLPANHNPELGGEFIRTVRPPDSEIQRNGANVPTQSLLQRVFWDVE
ncbi:MAG: SusD/RagB family nutrient-binding outer membrane lipoprotein [Balneolaceae bacterium]|nr:SusD/RagB family nutrient-binding outer membrane lipoprotein [Balneolaceae bacterium]MCH8548721.1 SusD/RagB family nutrient-binding outer membrane lipoprotein [Balneolaceae bacterium]